MRLYSQPIGGHPGSETINSSLITVTGQRWICTKLSPDDIKLERALLLVQLYVNL